MHFSPQHPAYQKRANATQIAKPPLHDHSTPGDSPADGQLALFNCRSRAQGALPWLCLPVSRHCQTCNSLILLPMALRRHAESGRTPPRCWADQRATVATTDIFLPLSLFYAARSSFPPLHLLHQKMETRLSCQLGRQSAWTSLQHALCEGDKLHYLRHPHQ